MSKLIFLVPVWGTSYTSLMLEGVLPSLLMSENFPILPQENRSILRIITTSEDADIAKKSSIISECEKFLNVEFVLGDALIDNDKYKSMSRLYMLGCSLEREYHNFVYLTPDMFCSNGTVSSLLKYIKANVKVIMILGFRVVKDSFLSAILKHLYNDSGNKVDLNTFISLALSNLHPMSIDLNVLREKFNNTYPSHLYWIDHKVMVAHGFHLHPIMAYHKGHSKDELQFKTIDDSNYLAGLGYSPNDCVVITSPNDMMIIEMSDSTLYYFNKSSFSKPSHLAIISWSFLSNASIFHWYFLKHKIVFALPDSCEANKLIKQSDKFINKLFLFRKVILMYKSIQSNLNILYKNIFNKKGKVEIVWEYDGIRYTFTSSVGSYYIQNDMESRKACGSEREVLRKAYCEYKRLGSYRPKTSGDITYVSSRAIDDD